MNTTLVIMAAGIGSRFGGGIKQLEKMGPNGEIIMDYSIYDARKAGFNKVVFIIRKDIEADFKEIVGDRIASIMDVEYVYQDINSLPAGYSVPQGRTKPWGTGQAVLMCKDVVKEPFAVINADDFYGEQAFKIVHDELVSPTHSGGRYNFCMAGFRLGNTLSANGAVTRGVCMTDESGMLDKVCETTGIEEVDGCIIHDDNGSDMKLTRETCVSMNMWGLTPEFFEILEKGFAEFVAAQEEGNLKGEYLLPTIIGDLLKEGKVEVKVLKSHDKWFGVTYKEDKELVVNEVKALVEKGLYPEK